MKKKTGETLGRATCFYRGLLKTNTRKELGSEGSLKDLWIASPWLLLRRECHDLSKVTQLAHNGTCPTDMNKIVRDGQVGDDCNQSPGEDESREGQAWRVQGHIARPCVKQLRVRMSR